MPLLATLHAIVRSPKESNIFVGGKAWERPAALLLHHSVPKNAAVLRREGIDVFLESCFVKKRSLL
jgi:hypothetical protein